MILRRGILLCIFAYATAEDVLQLHDVLKLFCVDAVGVVDVSVAVGESQHLGAQLNALPGCILCHVARARDEHLLACQGDVARGEHRLKEIHHSVARGFGAYERAAEGCALAGEHALELVGEFLVLPEEVAHLASAHADVAGRHVFIGTYVAVELVHESLAEAHHLAFALAARRKVAAALGSSHGQGGERVLESLLEGKELQDAQIHRLVVAQAAFVGTYGVVVLYAVAHVGAHVAGVVGPRDAELQYAVGDAEALYEVGSLEFGVQVVLVLNGCQDLRHCLYVLRLSGKTLFQIFNYVSCFHHAYFFEK